MVYSTNTLGCSLVMAIIVIQLPVLRKEKLLNGIEAPKEAYDSI
jgi:hypothetical protein